MRTAIGSIVTCSVCALILSLAGPARADAGHDFIEEARLIYQIVACGEGPAPAMLAQPADARIVAAHCQVQRQLLEKFRTRYVNRAQPFLARWRPADLPTHVIYPFGGGDLVSALITYPEATEITTISLEHAGDPRRVAALRGRALRDALAVFRESVSGLLRNHDSASEKMRLVEGGPIPGQLAFFLQGLVALGYEPVSLRYFRLRDDGSIEYLTQTTIAELADMRARKKAKTWVDTDHSVAFSNMELRFRRRGDASGPIRVHRHIAANLNNDHFAGSPLRAHLLTKGKVAAMTKAASYLLWNPHFSEIRSYLIEHMVFMFSDSTGIPPHLARRAGFEQITFGAFAGAFLPLEDKAQVATQFISLWQQQPQRKLPFRYGYPDNAGNFHMMITRPRQQSAAHKPE
jgi:hypothetical protein